MNTIICSEKDCFNKVDYDEIVVTPNGTYAPSLKCWDCRTANDKRNIKNMRKKYRGKPNDKEK